MFKPSLYATDKTRELMSSFKGYENNLIIDENAFCFEENISSDDYPVIAPRNKRAFFEVYGPQLHGLFSKERLCYINNNTLYYGAEAVQGLHFPDIERERFFVSMGTLLIIFPDKVYVNTENLSDYGSLEATFTGKNAECTLCRGDGDLYEGYSVGNTPPSAPQHGDLWVDTSLAEHALKQYSQETEGWIELEGKYIRISCPGIGKGFNQYDGVELTGFEVLGISSNHIIYDKGDDYIVVAGIIDKNETISTGFTVKRRVPDMDFVCESGNRLWGCSSSKNEIYASKLGDPKNFFAYMGISTDSYTASVGSGGDFTGLIPYRGYILFFKENCVHKIYGQNPPYTITTSYIRGVQKGSHKSLCCLNETLYYKSPNGICAYEGSLPVDVSAHLGKAYYTEAVGGILNNKYYICMTDVKGERVLFCYDEERLLWHREGNIDIREFANNNMNLYFLARENNTNRLGLIDGVNMYGNFSGQLKGFRIEDDFSWCLETGLWGLDLPEHKYYSSVRLRVIAEKGAFIQVSFQYNSSGKWEKQISTRLDKTGSFSLPFTTPRCDHLQMQIKGQGKIKIISIARSIESGSDLDV